LRKASELTSAVRVDRVDLLFDQVEHCLLLEKEQAVKVALLVNDFELGLLLRAGAFVEVVEIELRVW